VAVKRKHRTEVKSQKKEQCDKKYEDFLQKQKNGENLLKNNSF
jgi:hypothetical protein